MPHSAHELSPDMQKCMDECIRCHASCLETAHHCLHLGGKHADAHHITLLQDCAEICQTSANFLQRGSAHSGHTCAACAKVCRACETACRSMGDDKMMRACADACARCADSCEKMSAMAH